MPAIVVYGDLGPERREMREMLVIGRARDCDIRILGKDVAEHHCRFFMREGKCFAEHIGEVGYTLFNNRVLTSRVLQNGDSIVIGGVRIGFETQTDFEGDPDLFSLASSPDKSGKQAQGANLDLAEKMPKSVRGLILTCGVCGRTVSNRAQKCPFCQTEVLMNRRDAIPVDKQWRYLDDAFREVGPFTMENLIRHVDDGLIRRNTNICGPGTQMKWTPAEEAPGLARFLGLCHHCQSEVETWQRYCQRCGGSLVE